MDFTKHYRAVAGGQPVVIKVSGYLSSLPELTFIIIHSSGKYVTLAIGPRFRAGDVNLCQIHEAL